MIPAGWLPAVEWANEPEVKDLLAECMSECVGLEAHRLTSAVQVRRCLYAALVVVCVVPAGNHQCRACAEARVVDPRGIP